ncbi:glycosyltransferase family 4 protein [Campylobacter mucosalis]|uniref:glycosyltransferase family 4 protein n=1 Tax=Campylobacter mucosalis TaxID=202 RepID=UPI0014700CB7|nr:glycosyltransferase family 4 protein [Campylobacter mucosalis]
MKRVVFVSNFHPIPPLRSGAVQTWINEVAKRLMFFEPHTISVENEFLPIKEYKDGVYHHRIHMSKIYKRVFQKILNFDIFSYNDRVFKEIQKIKPSIVHFQNYHPGMEKIAKKIRNWNKDIKIIFHLHNIYDFSKKDMGEFDALIGCSNFIVDHFRDKIKAKRYEMLKNGVDTKKFIRLNKEAKDFINICAVSRVVRQKNLEYFIDLADELKDHPEYKFFIIGDYKDKLGYKGYDYYLKVKNLVKDKKLNIEIIGNVVPDKINKVYSFADICVFPFNDSEPFGMVAIEAMSAQALVIAHNGGGAKEYMRDNENCRVFALENFAKDAKECILNLTQSDISRLTTNARSMCQNQYDWDIVANDTQNLYIKLINE